MDPRKNRIAGKERIDGKYLETAKLPRQAKTEQLKVFWM